MKRKLISFDWAIKRILRSKANFDILEGFLTELLKEDIKIIEILESESNQIAIEDKLNRIDLKVKNENGEIILIEIQYSAELDYLKMNREEQLLYDKHEKDRHHEASVYESTYVIGEIMGRKKGKIEGKKTKQIEIARNLLDVLDVATISLKTGLSIEEVKNLK